MKNFSVLATSTATLILSLMSPGAQALMGPGDGCSSCPWNTSPTVSHATARDELAARAQQRLFANAPVSIPLRNLMAGTGHGFISCQNGTMTLRVDGTRVQVVGVDQVWDDAKFYSMGSYSLRKNGSWISVSIAGYPGQWIYCQFAYPKTSGR